MPNLSIHGWAVIQGTKKDYQKFIFVLNIMNSLIVTFIHFRPETDLWIKYDQLLASIELIEN